MCLVLRVCSSRSGIPVRCLLLSWAFLVLHPRSHSSSSGSANSLRGSEIFHLSPLVRNCWVPDLTFFLFPQIDFQMSTGTVFLYASCKMMPLSQSGRQATNLRCFYSICSLWKLTNECCFSTLSEQLCSVFPRSLRGNADTVLPTVWFLLLPVQASFDSKTWPS